MNLKASTACRHWAKKIAFGVLVSIRAFLPFNPAVVDGIMCSFSLITHLHPYAGLLSWRTILAAAKKRGEQNESSVLGLLIGLLVVPLRHLRPISGPAILPVATSDAPLPFEERIVHLPLHARIDREMVKTPPGGSQPHQPGDRRPHLPPAMCHLPRALRASLRLRQRDVPGGASALGTAPQWSRRRQRRSARGDILEGRQRYPAFRHAGLQPCSEPDGDVASVAAAGKRR